MGNEDFEDMEDAEDMEERGKKEGEGKSAWRRCFDFLSSMSS